MHCPSLRRRPARDDQEGQSLVEFALVMPVFVLLLMGVLEFGFMYNNLLTVQFAARQGVSAAAQAGAVDGADCSILNAIEGALSVPVNASQIDRVEIFLSDTAGDPITGAINTYSRGGTLSCTGTDDQPYTLVGSEGYTQTDRKDSLAAGLDIVGVRIHYDYHALTPVGGGRTWDLTDAATLRTEPKQ
jgi:Flp pilus assembly protein TadG